MNKQGHVLNAALLGVGLAFVFEPSGTAAETVRAIVGVTIPVTLGVPEENRGESPALSAEDVNSRVSRESWPSIHSLTESMAHPPV